MTQVEVEMLDGLLAIERTLDGSSPLVVEELEHATEVVQKIRRRIAEDVLDRRTHVVEVR